MTNLIIDTDSYKLSHKYLYPEDIKYLYTYGTFRKPLVDYDPRIVWFGTRFIVEDILSTRITNEHFDEAEEYFSTHMLGGKPYPWPRDEWLNIIENGGLLPVNFSALPDGTVVLPGTPVYTISASYKYSFLATWLETAILRIAWSTSTTATKSRLEKDIITKYFKKTVDDELQFLINSRLHDFGSRGVSSSYTAQTCGMAHLLSFDGTDTLIAGVRAQKWNNGKPIGSSILATEHSIMQSWIAIESELSALQNEIRIAESGSVIACVADTRDYDNFLKTYLPIVAPQVKAKNMTLVVRPDSGDTVINVIKGLEACANAFGFIINSKGYKQLLNSAVIQGDGIKPAMGSKKSDIERILEAVERAGFAASNVAFGMGGGLLQDQTRDSLYTAQKLSLVSNLEKNLPIAKKPTGDIAKASLPGMFDVRLENGTPIIYPLDYINNNSMLTTYYSNAPLRESWPSFDFVRKSLEKNWAACSTENGIQFSDEIKALQKEIVNVYFST